jgi:hypothetical protein
MNQVRSLGERTPPLDGLHAAAAGLGCCRGCRVAFVGWRSAAHWDVFCRSGFIRESSVSDDGYVLDVLASSRMNPLPQDSQDFCLLRDYEVYEMQVARLQISSCSRDVKPSVSDCRGLLGVGTSGGV